MASDSSNTVYVITGGNRGLGLGLVKALLARPATTVIATVRSEEASAVLKNETVNAAKGDGSILHSVLLDFTTAVAPEQVRQVVTAVGVTKVDVLINNAGGAQPMVTALTTTADDLRSAFETNTIAPLLVFQGLWPLLQKSSSPKLFMMSSSVGSISEMEPVPGGAYGPSRCAQNWLTRAIHLENKDSGLIAVALHPGWVQTRAGQFVADEWGFSKGPPDTLESSIEGMLKVIDGATKETSGTFTTSKGQTLGW
ncbi:NAD(P)-binding protein [Hypoxylon argillaceum]|nr:NAD(P)-binding protein [Hypoxylon argillaceum]KAI1146568.1 NAD(P)-binding protein [Nemania diffusa]